MKHVDALSRWIPEFEKQPESTHNFHFSSQMPSQLHFLSPSWQTGTDFEPVLDEDRWIEAMRDAILPTEPSERSIYSFSRENELLFRFLKDQPDKKWLWVPPSLRDFVLRLFHDPPSVGHVGEKKMLAAMNEHVWWYGMSNDVSYYCQTCHTCQPVSYTHLTLPTIYSV